MMMQLNMDGEWEPIDKQNIDQDKVSDASFDVCPMCGNSPCTCGDECPLGGDLNNDCADCDYRADYHYDHKTGDCVRNEE